MKTTICGALIALGLAFPIFAQLSPEYEEWPQGPVKWLMTDEELSEWEAVATDAEAQELIDLFWARRDPTPGTPVNEIRQGFEQRVEIADQTFKSGRTRGALTDRGRVFLLLGGPTRIERTSDAPDSGVGTAADPTAMTSGTEVWIYEGEHRPRAADDADFRVTFTDRSGNNDHRLARGGESGVNDLLLATREVFITQPDLESVPDYATASNAAPTVDVVEVEEISTEFRNETLEAIYAEFRRAAIPAEDDLHVTYGEYLTPDGDYYVPVQLYVPAGAGIDTSGELTFFGVIENKDGEIVAVYEEPATLVTSNRDAYYERSLMLQPGEYVGTFGLVRDDKPVALTSTELDLEPLSETDPSVSRLILSNNIFPLSAAQAETDPFAFGGLKVVPKGDVTFQSEDELWYFAELRNLRLTNEGVPKVRVKLDVVGERADGKPVKMAAPMMEVNAEPVKDTPGRYMVGSSFPSGAFPPGSYTLHARFVDAVSGQTWNREQQFTIVE